MGKKRVGVAARSQSSIEITFYYQGKKCRETIRLKPTAANLTRAERHRAAILLAIENGSFDYAKTFPNSTNAAKFAKYKGQAIILESYLEDWLKIQKKRLKASTYDGYRKIVENIIIPRIGNLTLADIKKRDIREWMMELNSSNKRLANIQSVLRKALTDAVEDEIIEINPLTNWTYKNNEPRPSRNIVDPFTPQEQQAILSKCPPAMANQIQFAFWTGLRTSELIALTWDDIDFRRGVIIVDKALTQAAKGKVETTKTKSSWREVKILAPAKAALISQKAHTYLKGGKIFTHPVKGTDWSGDQEIRKYWVSLLKQAQVRYRRPYQTRHTYASMMLSAGEHPMWVAKQMGHSNWAMIINVYGKWMPSADDMAGSRAEEKFKIKDVDISVDIQTQNNPK